MGSIDKGAVGFTKHLLVDIWDSKDVNGFVSHFAPDGTWIINTSPPAKGHDAIRAVTEALMATAKSSRHSDLQGYICSKDETPNNSDKSSKKIVTHGAVEYEREGMESVTCRWCDIFHINAEGKIALAYTFMDTSPLVVSSS